LKLRFAQLDGGFWSMRRTYVLTMSKTSGIVQLIYYSIANVNSECFGKYYNALSKNIELIY
jgi:hypothetical protein